MGFNISNKTNYVMSINKKPINTNNTFLEIKNEIFENPEIKVFFLENNNILNQNVSLKELNIENINYNIDHIILEENIQEKDYDNYYFKKNFFIGIIKNEKTIEKHITIYFIKKDISIFEIIKKITDFYNLTPKSIEILEINEKNYVRRVIMDVENEIKKSYKNKNNIILIINI